MSNGLYFPVNLVFTLGGTVIILKGERENAVIQHIENYFYHMVEALDTTEVYNIQYSLGKYLWFFTCRITEVQLAHLI